MFVIMCWLLSMIAALSWPPTYVTIGVIVTLLGAVRTQPVLFTGWAGWLQLAVMIFTPWVLAGRRARERAYLKQLRADEAAQMAALTQAKRRHSALECTTQRMESQIAEITDLYHVTKTTGRALHMHELFQTLFDIAPRLLNARGLRLIDLSGHAPVVLRAALADGPMRLPSHPYGQESSRVVSPVPVSEGGTGEERTLPAMEQAIMHSVLSAGRAADAAVHELVEPPATSLNPPPRRVTADEKSADPHHTEVPTEVVGSTKEVSMRAADQPAAFPEGVSRVAWAPLLRDRQPIGILVADELPSEQLRTLQIVADQLALQLSRVQLYQRVEALAVTDELTGLFVRHHFMELAREELERSKRYGLSCSIVMADLDRFKQKNDTYGHLVGDVVLRDVARLLQRHLREIDLMARFGGEEFILLLVETGSLQAMPIAQRLKQLVEVHPVRAYDELLSQTISIGVAGFPEHAGSLEELIERADQALYAAKSSGRNRVVPWSPGT